MHLSSRTPPTNRIAAANIYADPRTAISAPYLPPSHIGTPPSPHRPSRQRLDISAGRRVPGIEKGAAKKGRHQFT
ncbi:hypothetical protein GN956_G20272 [Arapaima gigas]